MRPLPPRCRRVIAACLLLSAATAAAQDNAPPQPRRTLLYPADVTAVAAPLRPFVSKLLAARAEQGPVEAANLKPTGVFARVVDKRYVMGPDGLLDTGTLGGRPFVFVTLPETFYGRTLLQMFSAIGYSAEDVLTSQLGREKVLIVFRWEEAVVTHPDRDGVLPGAWDRAVYPATWDNLFALVDKMAADPAWHYVERGNRQSDFTKLALGSAADRAFLLGFPTAGRQWLKWASYAALREADGVNWKYRQFLDRAMSASEHYTGDGATRTTFTGRPNPPPGFPEYLGPNRKLTELPRGEVAVIGLGALRVGE